MIRPKNIIRFSTYRNLSRNEMIFWKAVCDEYWVATDSKPEQLCEYTIEQWVLICKLCKKNITTAIASLKRKGLIIVDNSKYHASVRRYKPVPFWRADQRMDYMGRLNGLKGAVYEIDVLTGEKIPWDVKWLRGNGFSIGTPHKPKVKENINMTNDDNIAIEAMNSDDAGLSNTAFENSPDDLPPYPIEEFEGEGDEI